jgi:hypothetical protein
MLGLLSLFACSEPIEAPEELGDLLLYTFAEFDNEDDEYLTATLDGFTDYLLSVDMEGDLNDRAFTPPTLNDVDLGSVTPPDGADPALQSNVGMSGLSTATMSQTLGLIGDANQVCITSDTTKFYDRTFDTDLACFIDGSCDWLEVSNETRTESILASVWIDTVGEFRRVVREDDGAAVIFGRTWMPLQAISDDGDETWDQRYTLDLWLPHPTDSSIMRMTVMWSSVSLNEDLYVGAVKSGLNEAFENAAAFLAGEECKNDRDAEFTRE